MPITPELTQYISQARASGMSDDAIRTELLKTGWNIADVNEAIPPKIPSFASVVAPEPVTAQPVQAKPRRSHLGFIVTVVLLLLIGGAVYYFLPQILLQIDKLTAKDTPIAIDDIVQPVAPIPTDETAGWQTYRNEQYGFEFKYPSDYVILTDKIHVAYQGHPQGFNWYRVELTNSTKTENPFVRIEVDPDGYGPFFPDKTYQISESAQNTVVVGSVSDSSSENSNDGKALFIPNLLKASNGHTYYWQFSFNEGGEDYESVFKKILSTFRFISTTQESKEQRLVSISKEVLNTLKVRDYQKLEGLVSSEGLSFNEYPDSLDLTKNDVAQSDISEIPTSTEKHMFGYTDGKGDPIYLTVSDYIDNWIYNHDYVVAPKVVVNTVAHISGNTPNNILEYSAGRNYVAFHFDGFDTKYAGMDWTTIYLIFDEQNGNFKLRGIIKDNWTI